MKFTFLTTTKGRIIAALFVSIFILVLGVCLVLNAARKGLQQEFEETGLNRAVIEAAFDPQKQKHLLRAETLLFQADLYTEQNKYKLAHNAYADAVDELTQALGADSTLVCTVKSVQARFEDRSGRYSVAEALYREALRGYEKTNNEQRIYVTEKWLAFALEHQRKNGEAVSMALKAAQTAKSIKLNDLYFHALKSVILHTKEAGENPLVQREFDEALSLARSVHAKNEFLVPRLLDVAHGKMKHKDFQAATLLFGEAIERSPDGKSYFERGRAYSQLNDYPHAIEDLTTALKLQPDANVWRCARAEAYRKSGDFNSAVLDYSKVIELTPQTHSGIFKHQYLGMIVPQSASTYIDRGDVYLEWHKPQLAIADYSRAIALLPLGARADAYRKRAAVYTSLEQSALAKSDRESASKADQAEVEYNERVRKQMADWYAKQ